MRQVDSVEPREPSILGHHGPNCSIGLYGTIISLAAFLLSICLIDGSRTSLRFLCARAAGVNQKVVSRFLGLCCLFSLNLFNISSW